MNNPVVAIRNLPYKKVWQVSCQLRSGWEVVQEKREGWFPPPPPTPVGAGLKRDMRSTYVEGKTSFNYLAALKINMRLQLIIQFFTHTQSRGDMANHAIFPASKHTDCVLQWACSENIASDVCRDWGGVAGRNRRWPAAGLFQNVVEARRGKCDVFLWVCGRGAARSAADRSCGLPLAALWTQKAL